MSAACRSAATSSCACSLSTGSPCSARRRLSRQTIAASTRSGVTVAGKRPLSGQPGSSPTDLVTWPCERVRTTSAAIATSRAMPNGEASDICERRVARKLLAALEVSRVHLDVLLPLVRQLVLGEAGVNGTGLDACVAVDALLGVDVEHLDRVVI